MLDIHETPAGPDAQGTIHLMESKYRALCGANLTGDVVPEDCPLDCRLCHEEHPHDQP